MASEDGRETCLLILQDRDQGFCLHSAEQIGRAGSYHRPPRAAGRSPGPAGTTPESWTFTNLQGLTHHQTEGGSFAFLHHEITRFDFLLNALPLGRCGEPILCL